MITIKNIYRLTILHSICPCVLFVISLSILILVRTTNAISEDDLELPTAQYEEFQSKFIYNIERKVSSSKETNLPYVNFFLDDTKQLPSGYIVKGRDNSIDIGPKIRNNDWKDFLKAYKSVLTITLVLLLLLFLVPILGLIYCCCCLKCRGPCCRHARGPQHIICGLLLLFLLIGIIYGIVIAFIGNDSMDNGFKEMSKNKRSTETKANDMCTMLDETSQRLKHLFVKNYDHMQKHIAKHRTVSTLEFHKNLKDSSHAKSIKKLQTLTLNIPKIPRQLLELSALVKRAWFLADQLRDALRAVKRDITNTLFKMCTDSASTCKNFILIQSIPTLDMGCLHYDLLPNISDAIESFKRLKDANFANYVNDADKKLTTFRSAITGVENDMVPIVLDSLKRGAQMLNNQTEAANRKLHTLMKDIKRENSKPQAQDFMHLDERIGWGRYRFNLLFCIILIVITICLIISLILTFLNVGSFWFLVPIILIFLTFSLLILVGLYYFIMGLVLHRGVCMNSVDKHLSASNLDMTSSLDNSSRMYKGCEGNTSLYNEMKLDTAFDLDGLRDNVMGNISTNVDKTSKRFIPDLNFRNITLLTDDQADEMHNTLNHPNITQFNIQSFAQIMCKKLVPVSLPTLAINLEGLADKLHRVNEDLAIVALRNDAIHLRAFQKHLYVPLLEIVNQIHKKLDQIKPLMTDGEHEDYGKSIGKNIEKVKHFQGSIRRSGQVVIQDISNNMTEFVRRELDNYIRMVQTTVDRNQIGSCDMLRRSPSHSNSFKFCEKIVTPMNDFWFGILLSTLLLLPALYVAHKLRCLIYTKDNDDDDADEDYTQRRREDPDQYARIPPNVYMNAMAQNHSPMQQYGGGFPYDCHCPKGFNANYFGNFQYDFAVDSESIKLNKRKTD